MRQEHNYAGPERRKDPKADAASLEAIWSLLTELNAKLGVHIGEEAHIRPHLIELVDILQKSKGVVVFLKLLLFVAAPVAAFVAWAKDHIK